MRALARLCPIFMFWASLISVLGGTAAAQRGAVTLPRNLAQMTETAENIVHGRITSVRVEPHPQYKSLNSVVVTVAVSRTLKGTAAEIVTFRQFLWDPRDRFDAAGYRRGDEVILFLNKVTDIGFTSPVGLQQGRFLVRKDSSGQLIATNGAENSRLLQGMTEWRATPKLSAHAKLVLAEKSQIAGPIPVDVLEETVRALVANGGVQ